MNTEIKNVEIVFILSKKIKQYKLFWCLMNWMFSRSTNLSRLFFEQFSFDSTFYTNLCKILDMI